ncbi:MAG: DUF4870 family protein [Porticoccaceae bacterium]
MITSTSKENVSELSASTEPQSNEATGDKSDPGRGYIVVIYGLYIGSIMAVVTAPIGALIAHLRLKRGAPWLDSHLRFQIRTFWLGLLAAAIAALLWRIAGAIGLPPVYAWSFGYLFFTLAITWMMGRCAVGIHRLTANKAIDKPKSWLFGTRCKCRT